MPDWTSDPVHHPSHDTSSKARCSKCDEPIECIQVVQHLNFCLGNAIKYVWRAELKNGVEDLRKAVWYLNWEIERRENGAAKPHA